MGNLSRYSLSWATFLVALATMSGPVGAFILGAAVDSSERLLLPAIVVGGVLPFGYAVNLVPLLAFRFLKRAGLFQEVLESGDKSRWYATKEMESHRTIIERRLEALKEASDVIAEARADRADRWDQLIIHYNLLNALILALLTWFGIAVLNEDWSLGLSVILRESTSCVARIAVFGIILVVSIVLTFTARQTRWELICDYRLEIARLKVLTGIISPDHGNEVKQ